MATSLPVFPPFDVHLDSNAGPRWTKWLTRFERLIVGMNITDATQKRALLLHYAGPDVDDIFETLPDTGEDKDYKKAVEYLNTYFVPKVNMVYEEYQFRQAKQRSVTGDSPPQEIRPPLKRGAIFLGYSPPRGESPRNIAPQEGESPRNIAPL